MIGRALCLYFFVILLNGSRIFAEDTTLTNDESTTLEPEEHGTRTTITINDYVTKRPTNNPLNKVSKAQYSQEPIQNADDVIETLINKPKLTFGDEHEYKTSQTHGGKNEESKPGNTQKPSPSHFGDSAKPASKVRKTIDDAWNRTSNGIKNIGSGTYDAVVGAYQYVKDAAAAFISG